MKRTGFSKQIQKLYRDTPYIAIATVCPDGTPWNTPVAGFHFKNDLVIYWASWIDNQHSKNIRTNGRAFIVIFDSTPLDNKPSHGIYIQAVVSELSKSREILNAAKVFGKDPYNPSDGNEYIGSKPRRIYKATPEHIWTNADGEVNGDFVDVRLPIFGSAKN